MCSAWWPNDSRSGEGAHLPHAGRAEYPRARLERCPGRAHIIDHHYREAAQLGASLSQGEGPAHVPMTLRRREFRLGGRVACPPKRVARGHSQTARQIGSLVEPALSTPGGMERNRHHALGCRQQVGAAFAHQPGEGISERSPSLVFDGVHDGAQCPVVVADRTGSIDGTGRTTTSRAE
jgi:hypothetical protein